MAIYIDVVLSGCLGIMGMRLESRRQSRSQFCANLTIFLANDLDDPDRPVSCKESDLRVVFFNEKETSRLKEFELDTPCLYIWQVAKSNKAHVDTSQLSPSQHAI